MPGSETCIHGNPLCPGCQQEFVRRKRSALWYLTGVLVGATGSFIAVTFTASWVGSVVLGVVGLTGVAWIQYVRHAPVASEDADA